MITAFIDEHKDRTDGGLQWGVESICAVLSQHGTQIAPSTFYHARNREKTWWERRDEELVSTMTAVRRHTPFTRVFGARKMWLHLRGAEGIDVARCTVERLMAAQGWEGAFACGLAMNLWSQLTLTRRGRFTSHLVTW